MKAHAYIQKQVDQI